MKKYIILLIIAIFISGVVIATENNTVEAKKIDKKFKILKSNSDTKIALLNGKNITFKKVKASGKYAPSGGVWKSTDNKYWMTIGAHGTSHLSTWKRGGVSVFENDVRFKKNNKKIPKGKNFKIKLSPKLSFNRCGGEFTVYNPGTRYSDMDFCLKSGTEKGQKGKSWNQFYMKKIV